MTQFEATLPDPLGLWLSVKAGTLPPGYEESSDLSFSLAPDSATPSGPPVFRMRLSKESLADEPLTRQESEMAELDAALQHLPNRLEALLQGMETNPSAAGNVSFDTAAAETEWSPENELRALLNDLTQSESVSFEAQGGALAAQEPLSRAWRQARDEFQSFLETINQTVLHFAWVETVLDGKLIARSAVDWSGDTITAWVETADSVQKRLHHQTLERAARTRHLNLRLFTAITGGAIKIAALLTTGTPVLALPAAYRYVMAVIRQTREWQSPVHPS
ncbi:MAG: hypothetical protein N2117_11235 [Anaerolineales bacterium]|nr:hypothetical protein [Anaerolineales bacterium]